MGQGCPYQSHNLGSCQRLLCSGGLAHTTMCHSEGFSCYFLSSSTEYVCYCGNLPVQVLQPGLVKGQSPGMAVCVWRVWALSCQQRGISASSIALKNYLLISWTAYELEDQLPCLHKKGSLKMGFRHALFACMQRNCWLALPVDTVRTAAQSPLSLLLRPPRTQIMVELRRVRVLLPGGSFSSFPGGRCTDLR